MDDRMDDKLAVPLTGNLREDLATMYERLAQAAESTIDYFEASDDPETLAARLESIHYAKGRRDAMREAARLLRSWGT